MNVFATRLRSLCAVLGVLALVGLASAQQAGEEKPPSLQSVILKLHPGMELSPDGNLSFYQAMKDVQLILLPNLDMAVVEVPADWDFEMLAEVLEQDPMVEYAMPDTSRVIIDADPDNTPNRQTVIRPRAASMANRDRVIPNDSEFARLWHLDDPNNDADIDAPEGWAYTTGSTKVVVAVIDSGIDYLHPDLRNNIWINQAEAQGQAGVDDDSNGYTDDVHGWNACENNGDPWDLSGHGTAVASAVAAQGNNSYQITGAAWRASIMPLKMTACTSSSSPFSRIMKSIDYILTMKKLGVPVRVINISLTVSAPLDVWRESVRRLHEAGILLFNSSGNRDLRITSADDVLVDKFYDNVVVVGATSRNKNRSVFSDYNVDVVDLGAPGEGVLALHTGHFLAGNAHLTGNFSQAVFSSAANDQGSQWTLGAGWIRSGAEWRFEVRPLRGLSGLSRAGNGNSETIESAIALESPRIDLSAYQADTRLLLTFSPYRKLRTASINASNSYRYIVQARIGHGAWSTLEESQSDYSGTASLPVPIPTRFYQNDFQFRFCLGETGAHTGSRCVWRNQSDSLLNKLIDGSISASLSLRVGRVAIYDSAALYANSPSALRSVSGTSFSSPLVAGAAALLFSYNPAFNHRIVKRAVLQGVKKAAGLENYFTTGGILSIKGAFEALETIPTISFAQTEIDIAEGTTETVTVLVDPISPDEIVVQLTAAAATSAGVSFPSALTIPSEQPSARFDIGVAENDLKQNESLQLALDLAGANAPAFVGSASILTVNAIDNDQANSISFIGNVLSLREGTTQAVTIAGNELALPVTVNLAIAEADEGQITLSDRHADPSVSSTQLSINLPKGSTRYEIVVGSPQDDVPEREQTHVLQLRLTKHDPANTPLLIIPRMVITIPENDLSVLAFAGQTDVVLAEGGTTQLTITAKPAPTEGLTVNLLAGGSGGNDIQINPASFVLRPGQSVNTVTVTVGDDSIPEREEYAVIALELENPKDVFAKIDEDRGRFVITIPNDDILIQVFSDRNVIPEGSQAAILVQSLFVTDPVAVHLASDNSKGSLSQQRVELSSTDTAVTIHLSVADDDADPQPQFNNVLFNVSLSAPSHVSLNRTSLSFTIPPNDLTANFDKPAVLSARGDSDKAELSITGLQADKSFIVSSDDPNLVVPSGIITTDQNVLSVTVSLPPAVDRETLILPLKISYLDALRPAADPIAQISVGHHAHTCAVKTDNTIACWGFSGNGQADPPPGEIFLAVSTGYAHTCAVRIDNTAVCWGSNYYGQVAPPQGETFLAVSAGNNHTCGIRTDGTARCWGSNSVGQAAPPQNEVFLTISSGLGYTCGIRTDKTVACWGHDDGRGQTSPPQGETFLAISSGHDHTCGIRTDKTVACWGSNSFGQAAPPQGETFLAIGSGWIHTCGIRTDKTVACWGKNFRGQAAPPSGEAFLTIGSGQEHTCAVKIDGGAVCWGDNFSGKTTPPPDLQVRINSDTLWLFEKADIAESAAELRLRFEPASVAIHTDRNVISEDGVAAIVMAETTTALNHAVTINLQLTTSDYAGVKLSSTSVRLTNRAPRDIVFLSAPGSQGPQTDEKTMTVSFSTTDSRVHVEPRTLSYTIPPNDLTANLDKPAVLSVRGDADEVELSITGLQADKSFIVSSDDPNLVVSSGIITTDQNALPVTMGLRLARAVNGETLILPLRISYLDALRPAADPIAQISAGHYAHTCAVKTDNTIACWGFSGNGQADPPPGEIFLAVSTGYAHTCAVRIDNTAACWGSNSDGKATPPQGETFLAISSGLDYTCSIRTNGVARCWGRNHDGRATPPQDEVFLAISSGLDYTCGIRTDKTVACWGHDDGRGQTSPPQGETFLAISSGHDHTCGIRTDKTVACWGSNSLGQAAPPQGESFLTVSSGRNYTCAVKIDGAAVCWGENTDGQTTPPPDLQVRINSDTPWLFEKADIVEGAAVIPSPDTPALSFAEPTRIILEEGQATQLTITAMSVPVEAIAVSLQTASSDLKISPNPVTLRFLRSSVAVTVAAIKDFKPERPEEIIVGLSSISPQGLAQINERDRQAVITIPTSDTPTVTFAQNSVDVVEGATRTMSIFADPAPVDDVVVRLTLDRPSAGRIIFPGNLAVPPGRPSIQFKVGVAEDDVQQDESVDLVLSLTDKNAFARIGSTGRLTVNVIDNDQANSIGFTNNVLTLEEGATKAVTIASHELASSASISIAVAGAQSAKQISIASRYADRSAPATQIVMVMPKGSAVYEIIAEVPEDRIPERRQTYTIQSMLTKYLPASKPVLTVPNIAVTVLESDRPAFSFAQPNHITLEEGSTGMLTIMAAPAPLEDVPIRLKFDDGDITVSPSSLTLTSEQSTAFVTVTATADGMAEPTEKTTVTLVLDDLGVFAQIGDRSEAVITIPAHDTPTIAFAEPAAVTIRKGSTGMLAVRAMPAPLEDVLLLLLSDGGNIMVSPSSLTLTSGQSMAAVTVAATADGMAEQTEKTTVTLMLDDLGVFAQIGDRSEAVITIIQSSIRIKIKVYLEGALK